jgi:hypothetical protein
VELYLHALILHGVVLSYKKAQGKLYLLPFNPLPNNLSEEEEEEEEKKKTCTAIKILTDRYNHYTEMGHLLA